MRLRGTFAILGLVRSAAGVVLVVSLVATACHDSGHHQPVEAAPASWKTWSGVDPAAIKVPPPPKGDEAFAPRAEGVNEYQPVSDWLGITIDLVRTEAADAPSAARAYALTMSAMHDAVVVAWRWKYVYNRKAPNGYSATPSYPSDYAAMAAAAARVLAYLFPGGASDRVMAHRFIGNPGGTLDDLAQQTAFSRYAAGANYRSDDDAGLAVGRAVAARVITRARSDGSTTRWGGERPAGIGSGPGFWEPPPDLTAGPDQPTAGSWKPFLSADTVARLRPPAPPAYASAEFVAEAQQVVSLNGADIGTAVFWAAAGDRRELTSPFWVESAEEGAEAAALDLPHTLQLIAAVTIADYDTTVAVWRVKYSYWAPRPINAIRDLRIDPTWPPAIATPLSPSYPSSFAGDAGAATVVLSGLLRGDPTHWNNLAAESADSRLWGGVQFPSDTRVGLEMGRKVGQKVLDRLATK